ncbi:uncharacterized protein [Cardiocondyla obscurior]|uniref:uncharacterized protein isoform X2 n=1 Tax=Cardiocondyla obscurior TaxID=286306 RepID=UPI0039658329
MARKTWVIHLLIMIAFLCSCACYQHYADYSLEQEQICHFLNKKHVLNLPNGTAAIVTPHHMFDHWVVNNDRRCTFVFKTREREGLFAVIHKMSFRRDKKGCIDYVRFKRSDGHSTQKFCGNVNLLLSPISESYLDSPENADRPRDYNVFAEYDPIDSGWNSKSSSIETEIFISRDELPAGQSLDLTLVYTPFKDCAQTNPEKYSQLGFDKCIRKEYMCDKIFNCHPNICSDEKSQKLCWSSDCAGPNACSRPTSFPGEDGGQGSNRGVPTAPMLEVAVSSPVADKDLPPSYDSLFPEQSNPARS